MATEFERLLEGAAVSVQDFGLEFARRIANMAVDPHGYFEKKYTARIERAQSDSEISVVVAQLVQWVASSAISDEQRQSLDRYMTEKGYPSIDSLRTALLP